MQRRTLATAALLLAGLLRRGIYRPRPGWAAFAWRLAVALAAMAALLAVAVPRFDWVGLRAQPFVRQPFAVQQFAAQHLVGALSFRTGFETKGKGRIVHRRNRFRWCI